MRAISRTRRKVLSVQGEARRQTPAAVGAVHVLGNAPPHGGIALLGMMARLAARQLCGQVGPVAAGLALPAELIIDLVKALDHAVTPGLPLSAGRRAR